MTTTDTPLVHTINEVCEILRVSRGSVNELIHTGRLESFKVGHRRLVARSALMDLIYQKSDESK